MSNPITEILIGAAVATYGTVMSALIILIRGSKEHRHKVDTFLITQTIMNEQHSEWKNETRNAITKIVDDMEDFEETITRQANRVRENTRDINDLKRRMQLYDQFKDWLLKNARNDVNGIVDMTRYNRPPPAGGG